MAEIAKIDASLIVPKNDLESARIIEIARKYGMDVRVSKQPWGARLEKEPQPTFEDLKETVIIVEIPGPAKEKELIEAGHNLIIIDHHDYGSLNRSSEKSSLEQFAELIGHELTREEKLIAANDKSHVLGMITEGAKLDEIRRIRELDIKAQGYSDEEIELLSNDYKNREQVGKLAIVRTSSDRTSIIADLHQLPKTEAQVELYRKGKLKSLPDIMVITENSAGISKLSLYGSRDFIMRGIDLLELFPKGCERWHRTDAYGGFLGVKASSECDDGFQSVAARFIKEIIRQ